MVIHMINLCTNNVTRKENELEVMQAQLPKVVQKNKSE